MISFRKANSREIKRYADEKKSTRPLGPIKKTRSGLARTSSGRGRRWPLIGEMFGPEASQAVAQRRGRPRKASPKINQTLRLDAEVVEAYRRRGRGWQTRINAVLRAHMNDDRK